MTVGLSLKYYIILYPGEDIVLIKCMVCVWTDLISYWQEVKVRYLFIFLIHTTSILTCAP